MCNKRCFTKREAESIIRHNSKRPRQYRKESRAYYCPIHNAWHLTSKEWVDPEDIMEVENKEIWTKYMQV